MNTRANQGGFMGGLFNGKGWEVDPNTTPEMLKAKRELLAAMMPRYGKAQYVGEGLGQLFQGIGAGRKRRGMDKFEAEQRANAPRYSPQGGGAGGGAGGGPMSVLGMRPQGSDMSATDMLYPLGLTGPVPEGNTDATGQYNMGTDVSAAPDVPTMSEYIRQAAVARGIDPEIAVRVANSEGLNANPADGWQSNFIDKSGDRERSYGPFQLFVDGGLGNEFNSQTGLDPSDPSTWQAQVDFALDHAASNGWGAWYGAANSGIGDMDGIGVGNGGGRTEGVQVTDNGGEREAFLYSIINAPFASAGDKKAAQAELTRGQSRADSRSNAEFAAGLKQDDPVYQAQLRKLQLANDRTATRGGAGDGPAAYEALRLRAIGGGLEQGTPEFESFMINGGGDPAAFRALDMQAKAAGLEAGTPEYNEFMATRGAGLAAGAKATATNIANSATGQDAAAAKARGTAIGKDEGEDIASLSRMRSKMPGLNEVVDKLAELGETATYTSAGRTLDFARKELGFEPRDHAVARTEYIAMVDNQVLPLLRDTFGAQFTVAEGESLRLTLGDPNKSPAEKKAVLRAFIDQKVRNIEALQRRTEVGNTAPTLSAPTLSAPRSSADGAMPPVPADVDPNLWPILWENMSEEQKELFR